jgi:hypothetical protein
MSDRLFQPNHERRLLTTFQHVDEIVSHAVARLDAAATPSPLSEFVPDAQPGQHQLATESLNELRDLMRGFLETHHVPLPERNLSALWAAETACLHANLTVQELRASAMRGCGKLSPDAEAELETLVDRLSDLLQRMSEVFARAPGRPD